MVDVAWAQAGPGGGADFISSIVPMVAIFGVFYFLLLRPEQQKQKQHKQDLANLKKNDEVITSGGLFGRVMALADDIVTLEIAPNVKVRVARPQIATILTAPRADEPAKGDNKGSKQ